jgi:hypothetical protein
MARLIEIQQANNLPSALTVKAGDVLMFGATGGHVHAGAGIVEILGHYLPGVLGDNGQVFAPLGPPTTVLFRALGPGRAMIGVVTGDPFRSARTTALEIIVEP